MSSRSDNEVPDFLATLGLVPPCSVEDVKQAYRIKVKAVHPDAGGSVADFNAVQEAFDRAMQYARFRAGRMEWLSGHVEQYAAQQVVVAELEREGILVDLEQIDWLKNSFGADFAQLVEKVVGLAARGPQFGDETIVHLLSERHVLEGLRWLDLSNSRVTDRGVRTLSHFANLHRVDLRGTPAQAEAVELVGSLNHLEWIGLPRGAGGAFAKWRLRWRYPDLRIAADGEQCRPSNGR